ncbi:MAG: phosphoglucomutase/phosphomannomutase family protein [Candidatus Methanomethylicaceae archaeon]
MPYNKISFGTDGWRSRIDVDFNLENVRIVAKAIAEYLLLSGFRKGVFIGYDGRTGSLSFARACAEVLSSSGIPSLLPPRPVPTPVAAFATLHYSLDGAIMITASHNPPVYNGIKFIPKYGGPATTEITDKIESLLPQNPPSCIKYEDLEREGSVSTLNPIDDYLNHLRNLLSIDKLRVRVVVDSMHGATAGIADLVFKKLGAETVLLRGNIDPNFGGISPDPIPKNLEALREELFSKKGDVGFAFDGDGDRLAAVTNKGTFLLANQLLPLIYLHLCERRSMVGDVARTVATSHLVDLIAEKYGRRVIETPVGFKYIGTLIREKKVVVGGEESGGISFVTHIPEKDGIASAIMLSELIELSESSLHSLMENLYKEHGYLESGRFDMHIETPTDVKLDAKIPRRILGREVIEANRMDGLKILLEDGSWLLLRKSGTENVVRVYAEAKKRSDVEELIDLEKSYFIIKY